jgi:hypothetical protein
MFKSSNVATFKKIAGEISAALKEGKDISSIVGAENVKSFENSNAPSGYVSADGTPITNYQARFSILNNFSDVESKVTFSYVENSDDFENLKKDGFITENKKLSK